MAERDNGSEGERVADEIFVMTTEHTGAHALGRMLVAMGEEDERWKARWDGRGFIRLSIAAR